jgi:trigger factor
MLPEFETAVTGLAAGENKSFDLTFPAEYSAKDLAGQTVQFEVEVVKVEKPLYPAVDDEFAKSLGLESAEKMREEVLKNLQREVKARVTNRTKLEVMDQLTKLATFALPKALVADEQQNLANAAARRDGEELITVEDLLDLTPEEFAALEKQATDAFTAGQKREVESTPKKKNKVQPLR